MKKYFLLLNSTIFVVLFCFSDIYSLPLTRSCYTLPENKIDMTVKEEFIYIENMNRRDGYSFNIGISDKTSAGFDFSLINYGTFEFKESVPGDIIFNLWHFTGDFFDGLVDSGLSLVVRIPTGPDVYADEKCRNLSYGNSELKIAPVFSFNIADHEILILNFSYTFRAGRGENLYDGFNINPLKDKTYRSCFGFNPFYEDSFLDGENLKNDYASVSGGLLTSKMFPWIFFTEIYYSSGFYSRNDTFYSLNIEGEKVNPLLLSAGFKYFFSGSFFLQVSEAVNLFKTDGYIKNTTEFSLNIFF